MRKMSRKKLAVLGAAISLLIMVILLSVPSLGAEGALHINNVITECAVVNEYGVPDNDNPISATSTRLVITNSANDNKTFKCEIQDYGNELGSAVSFNFDNTGLGCTITYEIGGEGFSDFTNNWQETISANGDLKLTCQFNDNQ